MTVKLKNGTITNSRSEYFALYANANGSVDNELKSILSQLPPELLSDYKKLWRKNLMSIGYSNLQKVSNESFPNLKGVFFITIRNTHRSKFNLQIIDTAFTRLAFLLDDFYKVRTLALYSLEDNKYVNQENFISLVVKNFSNLNCITELYLPK